LQKALGGLITGTFMQHPMRSLVLPAVLALLALAPIHAAHYIIADNQTGRVLERSGANSKVQIASLTKIALAMVVLDWSELAGGKLGETAVVPEAAVASSGGNNPLGLQAGDALTLRDLLFACLLASDNAAAVTLADHLGRRLPNATGLDPVGNTVAHMNALARQLGMSRTLFLSPHGLDGAEGQAQPYSTAADLARLTRYAYSKAGLSFYVSQASRDIHIQGAGGGRTVQIHNTNKLLGTDHIDGVKTGRTARAGDCIILTSEHTPEVRREGDTVYTTPRRILVVLLGGNDRESEGLALIRRGWGLYGDWAAKGRPTGGSSTL